MKEVHTEDQTILGATLHSIVAWANLHLGFQHTYAKKNEGTMLTVLVFQELW
jgi:hypothetical protein